LKLRNKVHQKSSQNKIENIKHKLILYIKSGIHISKAKATMMRAEPTTPCTEETHTFHATRF